MRLWVVVDGLDVVAGRVLDVRGVVVRVVLRPDARGAVVGGTGGEGTGVEGVDDGAACIR